MLPPVREEPGLHRAQHRAASSAPTGPLRCEEGAGEMRVSAAPNAAWPYPGQPVSPPGNTGASWSGEKEVRVALPSKREVPGW